MKPIKTGRSAFTLLALLFVTLFTTGCSSFGKTVKSWITGKEINDPVATVTTPRFSDQENLRAMNADDRQYRRMNRERLEEEADLSANAGSLWVMEGQGAYLFSQNQMRMVGDLLNVRIEGGPKTQLQTKVRVIGKLLERLETPNRGLAALNANQNANQNQPQAGTPGAAANPQAPGQNPQAAAADPNQPAGAAGDAGAASAQANRDPNFAVQSVPTRIVEQLKDGSYRVRGMQPFMIGKREYKVIVTGIVRPEDFDDAGIEASKLLDPQFDIVSSRKGASL